MLSLNCLVVFGLVTRSFGGVTSDASAAANQTFDYIVVGAGLTGTTVAARLAESSSITVLLVEAGGDDRTDPRVYDIYNYGEAYGTELDWVDFYPVFSYISV